MRHKKKKPSAIFTKIIEQANKEIVNNSEKAAIFDNSTIRGDERAGGCKTLFE